MVLFGVKKLRTLAFHFSYIYCCKKKGPNEITNLTFSLKFEYMFIFGIQIFSLFPDIDTDCLKTSIYEPSKKHAPK